jgi:hypothetical protein
MQPSADLPKSVSTKKLKRLKDAALGEVLAKSIQWRGAIGAGAPDR